MKLKADIDFTKDLFDAANKLRGSVAPSEYKNFVLPLIFLRYLSLRYERRREELEALVSNPNSDWYMEDLKMREEVLSDEDQYRSERVYILPNKANWSYIIANAKQPTIKKLLDEAMTLIEEANPELEGVLPRNIYQASNIPAESIAGLIEVFSRDVFGNNSEAIDVLGATYIYFISEFASSEGQRGGEFFTPASIVKLLVAMLEPLSGTLFDPACGSGGMFVQSEDYTPNKHSLSFYGQENVDMTLRLGKMNVLMHGINADIRLGNSLLNDQFLIKHEDGSFEPIQFDHVIANPPFNLKDWGAERVSKQDPRLIVKHEKALNNTNANYMWMQHFLWHLAPGGTAGYVMANGAMTTNSSGEKEVRQKLVEDSYIDCIVQLPEKLFYGTGIPCCLFFLSKNRKGENGFRDRRNEILFIDARKKGIMVNRRQRAFTQEDIDTITTIYHAYKTGEGECEYVQGFCKVATIEDVKGNDYKLTPGIYVGAEEIEMDDIPFEEKMEELMITLTEQFEESNRLQEKIKKGLEGLF
ncbi:type I restriction-modification system subunit M [Domibacillus sp. PGB-M46]|uniref:type I restriction-modification system subunit M n=1 Tax=Domibacillus sp. PGB-M46 TaxID=2910255 RepID=UPI001F56FF61|nr:class I SAM-dependent DNA methyltransferase [Domibacillus sp. PGB-M46]MCI2255530.1 type I restriction-modification system subunit M [Domibacillus sp. PGB-M46]